MCSPVSQHKQRRWLARDCRKTNQMRKKSLVIAAADDDEEDDDVTIITTTITATNRGKIEKKKG